MSHLVVSSGNQFEQAPYRTEQVLRYVCWRTERSFFDLYCVSCEYATRKRSGRANLQKSMITMEELWAFEFSRSKTTAIPER